MAGWEYSGEYTWIPDHTIGISIEPLSNSCSSVNVMLKSDALEKQKECEGIYHLLNDTWSLGRQVD